jgi:hypothetical protein
MFAYLKSNWRTLAICTLAIALVFILFQDRNRNRFVRVSDWNCALDTRTGQFCDPLPQGHPRSLDDLPKCYDLAKGWR